MSSTRSWSGVGLSPPGASSAYGVGVRPFGVDVAGGQRGWFPCASPMRLSNLCPDGGFHHRVSLMSRLASAARSRQAAPLALRRDGGAAGGSGRLRGSSLASRPAWRPLAPAGCSLGRSLGRSAGGFSGRCLTNGLLWASLCAFLGLCALRRLTSAALGGGLAADAAACRPSRGSCLLSHWSPSFAAGWLTAVRKYRIIKCLSHPMRSQSSAGRRCKPAKHARA